MSNLRLNAERDMLLAIRTERLRDILRTTLQGHRAPAAGAAEQISSGSLSGPWAALFEERDIWQGRSTLNRRLYEELRASFDKNQLRELLLAAAGVKVSRTSVRDSQLDLLRRSARTHGFAVAASKDRLILRVDVGKGGWANGVERMANPGETGGVKNVYLAEDQVMADIAMMLDEAGEDDLFGALLGIPSCCRQAFTASKLSAAQQQNDFVPYVVENTEGAFPYDWRLNYTAQYFGSSLLSFFPCSFCCSAAAAAAERSLELLRSCDPAWATQCSELQRTNVLYTERDGLHLFPEKLREGVILYNPERVLSTETTKLAALLQTGNRLVVTNKHKIMIYRDSTGLAELSGFDTCMCSFH